MATKPAHPEVLTCAVEIALKTERRVRITAGRVKSNLDDQMKGNRVGHQYYNDEAALNTTLSNFKRMKSQELQRWYSQGTLEHLLPGEKRDLDKIKGWIALETDEILTFENEIRPDPTAEPAEFEERRREPLLMEDLVQASYPAIVHLCLLQEPDLGRTRFTRYVFNLLRGYGRDHSPEADSIHIR